MNSGADRRVTANPRGLFVGVFVVVLAMQLALVATTGTDIPFQDQWNVEGQWLYPKWRDGSLAFSDLLQPWNEHRILWTHLLNLGLFAVNGQWDPLAQLAASAVLRAMAAGGLAWMVAGRLSAGGRIATAGIVVVAFLPHLAWHGVLWGFESQVYFCLLFSLGALALLGAETLSPGRIAGGMASGVAALLAMGAAALVPVALLGLAAIRGVERRRLDSSLVRLVGSALGLLVLALLLRVEVPAHAALKARDVGTFLSAAARMLSWPHVATPIAAVVINLPLLTVVAGRLSRRRTPAVGEDFVLLVGGWSGGVGLATAWTRGGGSELLAGVPSRYVDFIVLLALANVWSTVTLVGEAAGKSKNLARAIGLVWGVFLFVGWLGLSSEVVRRLIIPRMRDRDAPVRLLRAYQATGNASVFEGQPVLLVPHPDPAAVRAVLEDPRLKGALPPSLQPGSAPGPLSRAVQAGLGR